MERKHFFVLGLLLAACGIDRDAITGDVDGGQNAHQAPGDAGLGPPLAGRGPGGEPRAEDLVPYEGCDVDLTCSEGCAAGDFDPDCRDPGPDSAADGGLNDPGPEPPEPEAMPDQPVRMQMEAGEERWWLLEPSEFDVMIVAGLDSGEVTLIAYAADGSLLARSTRHTAILVEARPDDPEPVRVRVIAGEGGAAGRLWRVSLDGP